MGYRTVSLLLVVGISGCFRGGFELPADRPAPADQGPTGKDVIFTTSDLPQPDLALSGINEPCKPPSCLPGLTCTWKEQTRFCRPPCQYDASVCPDGQACGRPTLGTKSFDPTAPRVCMPTASSSRRHESCKVLPCEQGLLCIKGDLDNVCLAQCSTASDCQPGETCEGSTTKGQDICLPTCTSDAQCAGKMRCVGFGKQMVDHCLPNAPVKLDQACSGAFCGPGMRCFGWNGQKRICRKTCPKPGSCAAAEHCVTDVLGAGTSLCLKHCGLFDSPSKCPAGEVCFASAKALKTFCMPGTGDPTSCATVPCASGKLCVNGTCNSACDDKHHCPGMLKCATLSSGGKTIPWKACLPP